MAYAKHDFKSGEKLFAYQLNEMEEQIANNAEALGNLSSGVEDVALPDYWKTHIDAQIVNIRTVLESAAWNKSAFFWYNDAHWTYSNQKSPAILKYLYKHTPINKTNFGGDICGTESENRENMLYLWDWRKAIRDLPNHHSVVGNHDDGNGTNNVSDGSFPTGYTYSWLLAPEETPDIVRGDEFYYYIDCPAEKTRYIYLDTATKNYNIMSNAAQQEFVKEALKSTPDGWHIVAIAHIWRTVDYDVTPPADNGWSYGGTTCLQMFHAYNNRSGEYADCGGKVEFCIGGHTHVDASWLYENSIPVILTECECYNVRSGLPHTEGTINESSVNAVIADYNNNKIHIIRIGRGESRVVAIPGNSETGYTNVLPLAIDSTGAVFNASTTPGYAKDTRINSSGVTTTATNWYATGFIPIKRGDVLRFKNLEYFDISGDGGSTNRTHVTYYDSNFNKLDEVCHGPDQMPSSAWSPAYGDNGDVIQLTFPTALNSATAYIRITFGYLDKNSIITINEEIV